MKGCMVVGAAALCSSPSLAEALCSLPFKLKAILSARNGGRGSHRALTLAFRLRHGLCVKASVFGCTSLLVVRWVRACAPQVSHFCCVSAAPSRLRASTGASRCRSVTSWDDSRTKGRLGKAHPVTGPFHQHLLAKSNLPRRQSLWPF